MMFLLLAVTTQCKILELYWQFGCDGIDLYSAFLGVFPRLPDRLLKKSFYKLRDRLPLKIFVKITL